MAKPELDLAGALNYNLTLLHFNELWTSKYQRAYKLFQYLLTLILIIQTSMVFVHVLMHLKAYKNDPEAVTLPGCIMILLKAVAFRGNITGLSEILVILKNGHFQPKNENQWQILKKATSLSRKMFICVASFYFVTILSWVVNPLMGEDVHLPMNCWLPFDDENPIVFTSVYVYQVVALFIYTGHNIAINCFFAICMILIGAQCEILANSLEIVQENDLIECIQHYNSILKFSQIVSDSYREILMIQFSHSVFRICIVLYELSIITPSNPQYYILFPFLIVVCGEIFFYCWFANEMAQKSMKLHYALFSSDWTAGSKLFKKEMLVFMNQIKDPIILYAWNIFPINVETFIKIMQKAWAFFTALRSTNKM